MPFPLIPIIIVGVSALLGGLTVKFWENILILLKGKNVAILGAHETGKTTLHKFLRYGEIVFEHNPTKKKKVKGKRFQLNDLELILKEGTDIGGVNDYLKDWKEIVSTSEICFYLFDANKVYNSDFEYIDKISTHLSHISGWIKEFKISPKFYIIGTFADYIEEYNKLTKSETQIFEQKIREKIKIAYLKVEISASSIFIGSLKDQNSIEKLLIEVLNQINDK